MATIEIRPGQEEETREKTPHERLLDYGKDRGYKLDWLSYTETFGTKLDVDPERGGLPLQNADHGSFAEAPERSENLTGRPRGAIKREAAPHVGNYRVMTKADIWLRNGASLYEEAVQRQWSSATDIPWHTLRPLPEDIERAQCELSTFLTAVEFIAGDIPGKWIADASPDFYEPRMFLVTQVMDEARHLDVFRKRALANGGGLTSQGMGLGGATFGSNFDTIRDFTEMSARLHLSAEGLVLTLFRMGERMSYNEVEKSIYRLAASDESRHVAFGVMHLKYVAEAQPERKEEIHTFLDELEMALVAQAESAQQQNPLQRGGIAGDSVNVLLGGGDDHIEEGASIAIAMRQRQIKEYVQRVKVSGFGERFENGRAAPALEQYASA